ncbi:DUF4232 domain-containing protein [Actinacidiphila glaucinigra]|uniref:DUF4232 domain-containing protein n=1 Tax=Actinacidiphila glaucinigra TaxID=235986 RepID=A0A239M8F9_9ACTN|nr:DUF4232 domain-containing protein [Actinacidiphila glaucinigra]SNT38432.1 Protein of unknown function [Actinacidiphila glaucinigra]
MRSPALLLPAVLAGPLLLATACVVPHGDGRPSCASSAVPVPSASAGAEGTGDVEITAVGVPPAHCTGPAPFHVAFRVTNHSGEPLTYTVTFGLTTGAGEALANVPHTVPAVPPGRTVRGEADLGAPLAPRSGGERVRVVKVRSVPADEAPAPGGACPSSGLRLTADEGDAAMGLRVVGLRLENCSSGVRRVEGHPLVRLLDEERKPVTDVEVFRGSGGVALVTGFDDPPRPVTLAPGESATAGLMWRNTVTDGTPVNAPYARVRATPGSPPVTLTPEFDLGTTGKLGVSAWKAAPAP